MPWQHFDNLALMAVLFWSAHWHGSAGVAMEVYEQHLDLEQVRALLGHTRIETTQLYAQIRPAALKQAVDFYEAKALDVLRP